MVEPSNPSLPETEMAVIMVCVPSETETITRLTVGMAAAISIVPRVASVGVVLTCKDRLVHYYAKFGFADEGVSASTHGDVVWHQMRLTF